MNPIPVLEDVMVKGMTQNQLILRYLKFHRRLTPIAALRLFGCFRLAARILELKQEGYDIRKDHYKSNGKWITEYYLPEEK